MPAGWVAATMCSLVSGAREVRTATMVVIQTQVRINPCLPVGALVARWLTPGLISGADTSRQVRASMTAVANRRPYDGRARSPA